MKNRISAFSTGIILCLVLSACGSTKSLASTNLICASVESYQSTKSLALVEAAKGGSALESINSTIGGLKEGINPDSIAFFNSYLNAMQGWANAVDQYQLTKKSDVLTAAANNLENQIDLLVPKCEGAGWRFENGWRS